MLDSLFRSQRLAMWFKNLALYRFTKAPQINRETLDDTLTSRLFYPCPKNQPFSLGWTMPLGDEGKTLTHSSNGLIMLCLRKEERVLPAASVRDRLAERIQHIEAQESRKIRGKEKLDLKDEVLLDMMPQAFTRNSRIYGYLDLAQGWLVIDASSRSKADEFQETLRETLGSLPVRPLAVNHAPADTMTRWVHSYQPPAGFEIGHDLDLKDTAEEGGVIRFRKQNLDSREIRAHIDCGMQASVIALNFNDRFDCLIDENLSIKRLRYSDAVLDAADEVDSETAAQHFDTDFALMGAEIRAFLPRLVEIFGGEPESMP